MKIGIIGKQCAGKSSVAKIIQEIYGGCIIKFADPIYTVLKILDKPKHRLFMQEFSDLAKKHFGENIFVELMEQKIQQAKCDNLYCDDIRYLNEIEMLRKYGFKFIFVGADAEIRKQRALQQGLEFNEDHNSERLDFSIPDVYYVENNGTLEELREKIENFIGAKVY